MSTAVVALALLESVQAFSAPALRAPMRSVSANMMAKAIKAKAIKANSIGVTQPLGIYDPLGLIQSRNMDRYNVMEIKHGRAAMLGFLHVIAVESGVKIETKECLAAPSGLFASLESMPTAAWLQIMIVTCMMETGYFAFEYEGYPNVGDKAPGDIGGSSWVRYDDPEVKAFKLNAERNNGRAAMLGITGCLLHELVGADALYPTGGLGGGAPPTIF